MGQRGGKSKKRGHGDEARWQLRRAAALARVERMGLEVAMVVESECQRRRLRKEKR